MIVSKKNHGKMTICDIWSEQEFYVYLFCVNSTERLKFYTPKPKNDLIFSLNNTSSRRTVFLLARAIRRTIPHSSPYSGGNTNQHILTKICWFVHTISVIQSQNSLYFIIIIKNKRLHGIRQRASSLVWSMFTFDRYTRCYSFEHNTLYKIFYLFIHVEMYSCICYE